MLRLYEDWEEECVSNPRLDAPLQAGALDWRDVRRLSAAALRICEAGPQPDQQGRDGRSRSARPAERGGADRAATAASRREPSRVRAPEPAAPVGRVWSSARSREGRAPSEAPRYSRGSSRPPAIRRYAPPVGPDRRVTWSEGTQTPHVGGEHPQPPRGPPAAGDGPAPPSSPPPGGDGTPGQPSAGSAGVVHPLSAGAAAPSGAAGGDGGAVAASPPPLHYSAMAFRRLNRGVVRPMGAGPPAGPNDKQRRLG